MKLPALKGGASREGISFSYCVPSCLPVGRHLRPKGRGLRGTCRSTCFHYIRCLSPLRALGNLKLHLFSCPQGSKTVTRNAAVMNKNVITTWLLNEPIPLLRVEPLHKSLSQNQLPPFQPPSCLCRWSPASKRLPTAGRRGPIRPPLWGDIPRLRPGQAVQRWHILPTAKAVVFCCRDDLSPRDRLLLRHLLTPNKGDVKNIIDLLPPPPMVFETS